MVSVRAYKGMGYCKNAFDGGPWFCPILTTLLMFFKALLKKYSMHIAEIYQITASITSDGGYSAFEAGLKSI